MAPPRALSPHTPIVVRDARSDAVVAHFLGGKPAGEVCDALERLTGSPGCLVLGEKSSQGAPLVLTESDVIQSGTYHWRVAISRSSSQPSSQPPQPPYSHTRHRNHDWSSQLAASVLAILILGSGIQLLIMLAALPFCDYRWSCAFRYYRAVISFIDGPFKVFAFFAAIQAAGRNPGRWLWFVKHLRLNHTRFSHIRLGALQGWVSRVWGERSSAAAAAGGRREDEGRGGGRGKEDRRDAGRGGGRGGRSGRGGRGVRKSSSSPFQGKRAEAGSSEFTQKEAGSGSGLEGRVGFRPVLPAPSCDLFDPPGSSRRLPSSSSSSSPSSSVLRRSRSDGGGGGDASKPKAD
ncbi:hypothetical protein CLOM_g1140 [Closterium sp. NIES-68]|nr:hypothetical protein CLOM_g1140 [Closterium sp. NIES-68]GJP65239.1 hypothetical protein CLOP_g22150 [Closterium sp. NIES-67]